MKRTGTVDCARAVDRVARHRPWHDVAANDDLIDTLPMDLVEHRFQSGQVAVYVVEGRDSHCTSGTDPDPVRTDPAKPARTDPDPARTDPAKPAGTNPRQPVGTDRIFSTPSATARSASV